MHNQRIFEFHLQGVRVFVPDQDRKIGVRRVKPGLLRDMPGKEGYFVPKRLVIQLEFYDEDFPEKDLISAGGRARLEVRYTPEDVENAGGDYRNLKLGYFWQSQWWRFTAEKHQFELFPDGGDPDYGVGVAYLETWDDPPIGWDD